MTLEIALIRHGQDAQGKLIGITDTLLSEEGGRMISKKAAAGGYPVVQMVYSSNLLRCVNTAQLIYQALPVILVEKLRALDYGAFEGEKISDLKENPRFLAWCNDIGIQACPGGEEPYALQGRCVAAFGQICGEMASKGIEKAAIIAHKSTIQAILQRFYVPRSEYIDWDIAYGGGRLLLYDTVEKSACVAAKI